MKPRRWLRFSLRTFFVLLMLVAIQMAWVAAQLKWIRDRKSMIDAHKALPGMRLAYGVGDAPGALWLFGERPIAIIFVRKRHSSAAQALFPEADVRIDGSDH